MKRFFNRKAKVLIVGFLLAASSVGHASVYLRYHNKDSKNHVFTVRIAGMTKTVEFGSSRTASVTIAGGSEEAEIQTACGWEKVKDGDNITIQDGCID